MSLIDDIKRDREAGTPGPWNVIDEWNVFSAHLGNTVMHGSIHVEDDGESDANAARCARVPDMEAALLAADELARAFVAYEIAESDAANAGDDGDMDTAEALYASVFDEWERAKAALAAYRKAVEGKS